MLFEYQTLRGVYNHHNNRPHSSIHIPLHKSDMSLNSNATSPGHRKTKSTLIDHLKSLHRQLIQRHDAIAGFQIQSHRDQQPAALVLATALTGLDYNLEMIRNEIGSGAYCEYLQGRPVHEIRGMIWDTEQRLLRMGDVTVGPRH